MVKQSLNEAELRQVRVRLQGVASNIKQMKAEELIRSFIDLPSENEQEYLEEVYFTVGKNVLIEEELAIRATRIKGILSQHQGDQALVYCGPSLPIPSVGDVCKRLLARIQSESRLEPSNGLLIRDSAFWKP